MFCTIKRIEIIAFLILVSNERVKNSARDPCTSRKLALLIANGDYQRSENNLGNAVTNADALERSLISMNFTVTNRKNISHESDMMNEVKRFNSTIRDGDSIFFYYYGHGYQFEDENYLIPTADSRLSEEEDVQDIGLDAAKVLGRLREKKRNSAIIFILDCCRPYILQRPPQRPRK